MITTAQPHGLVNGNTATITGVSGTFVGTSLNSTQTVTVLSPTSYSVPIDTTRSFQVVSIAPGNPCTITTAEPHGMTGGESVTLNGIGGGAFSPAINGTFTVVAVVDATSFTVASNCTSPPTSYVTWREVSNPCRVTTVSDHGLTTGDTVTISGVTGTTAPSINSTYSVTILDATSFSVPGVNCTVASAPNTGSIVGGNTLDVNATGMVNVAYSQAAGSNLMTVMTGGPQTNVPVPVPNSATTTLKSRVYLDFLTNNSSSAGVTSISIGYPCEITTAVAHGLTTGNSVTLSGVAGGTFTPAINGSYTVTVTGANTFTILSTCTRAPIASISTGNPCTVTTMVDHGLSSGNSYTISGVSSGTFSPAINAAFTITVTGPNTFTVPSNCTVAPTIAPKMTGAHGPVPADGVYDVETTSGSTSFTVTTADTPTTARSGNVIVPKITHELHAAFQQHDRSIQQQREPQHAARRPCLGRCARGRQPRSDAEYVITDTADEDHFKTSHLPVTSGLGTYPKPNGSNNGITLFPLVAPPMGRSGSVVINQSTFNLNSTEGTLAQSPLNAPTVFNFFFPDYKFPGTLSNLGIDSPEFQLSTDTNLSNLTNSLTNMFIGTGGSNGNLNGLNSFNNGNGTVVVDLGAYMTNAKTADAGIPGLIDELAGLLVGAPLDPNVKSMIQDFVTGRRITAISTGNPCTITSANHRLVTGNSVAISGVTGGTFSPGINATFTVTVTGPNTFTVPSNCTVGPTSVASAYAPRNFPFTTPTALQRRDRVRAIIHLILASAPARGSEIVQTMKTEPYFNISRRSFSDAPFPPRSA